jgi:hypothetical protein
VAYAAQLLGTTQAKLCERAFSGEFAFQENKYGSPSWFLEREINAARAARIAHEREKVPRKPRAETKAQVEARWARQSKENQSQYLRGGAVSAHYERVLLSKIAESNIRP